MERGTGVMRLLEGVDHQLLPHGQTALVDGRQRRRRRKQLGVVLAQTHALEREQRPGAAVRQARG